MSICLSLPAFLLLYGYVETVVCTILFVVFILQVVGSRGNIEISPRVAMMKELTVHAMMLHRSSEVMLFLVFVLHVLPVYDFRLLKHRSHYDL